MAERRIRYSVVWVLVAVSLVAAVVLLTLGGPVATVLGLGLLLGPLAFASLVLAAYYVRARSGHDVEP